MELTFDYYKNAQDAEIYLCNPDKSLLGALYAKNKNVILRFNSISELTFEVPKYVSNSAGEMIEHPYYERIATKRLVKVDKIGWFRIIQAVETENATGAVKAVTAESHQAVFKDMGFVEENRLYKFYDATDIYDENYDPDDAGAIPSVVGQLYQQLGITCDLNIGDITPTIDYEKWKIIWIEEALRYSPAKTENVCRTLKGSDGLFGYDFMVSNVEDAFQVIFEFDFLHHAIKIKSAASVATKTNIYLSFENLVQELALTEKSDEIVTVLSCKGTDLDITSVNPMGTNYICDFSYFMGDETNGYPWMSKALTGKLIEWKANVDASESTYSDYVAQLQDLYLEKTEYESKKTFVDLKLKDTEEVRDQYINNQSLATSYFGAETVETGEKSRERNSVFYSAGFSKDSTARAWKCYAVPPVYNADTNSYAFEGEDCKSGTTLENCFTQDQTYLYFMDGDTKSYCKIKQGTSIEGGNATYFVDGFERFTAYKNNGYWYDLYAEENKTIDDNITRITGDETTPSTIKYVLAKMSEIAEQTNILTYFAAYPTLFDELKCYWVDGQYTNDTLKAVDGTTVAENLELAKELMDAGKTELNRVCQPRFSFTVTSANFLKMPQFLKFAREIALGKVVTVEKNENTHYFPALTEMAFSLDTSENFSLTFSNSLKLTDWGYTYADLIKSASSTTRTVESNWSNLMDYSQSKEQINQMLYNTLDRTLRAGMDNAYAQDFVIDNSGILGRKKREDGTFEDYQVRMTNNLLVFTRDNWQTACTALGQIYYDNPDGTVSEGYGLATEVLVGKMIIGENLWIGNESGSVQIDANGIEISNGYISSSDYSYDEGSLPYATKGIMIDLGALPYIRSTNFSITEDGDAYFKGNLDVESLTSENFNITSEGDVSCKNITIDGGVIKSSNYTSEEIQEEFAGSESITTKGFLKIAPTTGTSGRHTYRLSGIINVEDADGILEVTRTGTLTYMYEGATYTPYSIEINELSYSGNYITYDFTVVTQPHIYNLQYYTPPYNFIFTISYTAYKITGYKCTAGSIINLGNNPYIIFPKFKIDIDGKLTADGAIIYGEVYSERGKIGGININNNSLTSDNGNFILSSDGTISVNGIETIGSVKASTIGGIGDGNGFLDFNNNDAQVEQVSAAISSVVTDEGEFRAGLFYKLEPGNVNVQVTLSKPTNITKVFVATINYSISTNSDTYYTQKTYNITISAGSSQSAILSVPNLIRIDYDSGGYSVYEFSHSSISPSSFLQNSGITIPSIRVHGNISPDAVNSDWQLGSEGLRWKEIWCGQSSINSTSDKNEKNSIEHLSDKYGVFFDELQPVRYKFNQNDSNRYHVGFIAQDVAAALSVAEISTSDFAGYLAYKKEDGSTGYGLRYSEFIALNTYEIQKLKSRVAELEKELKEIKGNET